MYAMKPKVLIIGAKGQLGIVLTRYLQDRYGQDQVVATDIQAAPIPNCIYDEVDASDYNAVLKIVEKYKVDQIYHLAAILSAKGEQNPINAWDINMQTWLNVLEVAKSTNIKRIFYPSSIAVFGGDYNKYYTGNDVFLSPATVYGVSKAAGENWANYYHQKYDLDIRSLRYPGVLSYQSIPSGGTTDYAVEIFHKAIIEKSYQCYLSPDTELPMIFIDDAIKATVQLMEAPPEAIKNRSSYNLAGVSFSPKELVQYIKNVVPDFEVSYQPDYRQNIALEWPRSIDDATARSDWGWQPEYGIEDIVEVMFDKLKKHYKESVTSN